MKVAVVGSGGLVGRRVVSELECSRLPVSDVILTGHSRSIGKTLKFRGKEYGIVPTDTDLLRKADAVVLATPTGVSKEIAPALRGGPLLVDTSSAFRLDRDVPLVVPEVNGATIANHKGLIAGPNCSTIQLVMVLNPLHKRFGVRRVIVSTYQSVSGLGYSAMRQLEDESRRGIASGRRVLVPGGDAFPYPIAFNVIPHIDSFEENGYTREEMKMVLETRKILGIEDLPVSATAARVPVFVGHCESVLVETEIPADPEEARSVLAAAPGVAVLDDPVTRTYPLPITAEGRREVFVGRVRRDLSSPRGLLLWVVADNLLRGAASNAVGILEKAYDLGILRG